MRVHMYTYIYIYPYSIHVSTIMYTTLSYFVIVQFPLISWWRTWVADKRYQSFLEKKHDGHVRMRIYVCVWKWRADVCVYLYLCASLSFLCSVDKKPRWLASEFRVFCGSFWESFLWAVGHTFGQYWIGRSCSLSGSTPSAAIVGERKQHLSKLL